MAITIGVIRGATEEEVKSKKFNIYMGISLNNKWFTKRNIKEYILWGLKNTKKKFCVVIADAIQSINYNVRDNYSEKTATEKALKEGDKFLKVINELLDELPKEKRKLIDIIRWADIENDTNHKITFPIFLKEFKTNILFKEEIKNIIRDFISKLNRPNINFSEEKIEKLSLYILKELPELSDGFTYNNVYYNCILYHFDSSLLCLIEKIQKK